ncbi:IS66 family insertion sequence element accessory protein TnpB [Peribacillus sp. NPDC006672]
MRLYKVKNIYIICGKTDMRKGIGGLATMIQELDTYRFDFLVFWME